LNKSRRRIVSSVVCTAGWAVYDDSVGRSQDEKNAASSDILRERVGGEDGNEIATGGSRRRWRTVKRSAAPRGQQR
jgi:hypothetical protein